MMMKKPVLILWFMFTSSVATLSILPNVNDGYWLPGQSVQSTYVSVGGILDIRGQLTGKQCGSQANSDYYLGSSTEQDWSLKSAQFYAYCFEQVIRIFSSHLLAISPLFTWNHRRRSRGALGAYALKMLG